MSTDTRRSYTIQGREVPMPVEVRDAANATAMFMVPAAAAQALVPGDAFEVVDAGGGMTQLLLGLIDYRDNDLGDYNEIAVILFVKPREGVADDAGTFIYKLPVNQPFTYEAGRTIWGFPKTVDRCAFAYADGMMCGELTVDGHHAFTLTVPCDPPETADEPLQRSVTYTYIDGAPHRTVLAQGGPTSVMAGDRSALQLGDHALADELRTLGLPAQPVMCTWTPHMRGTFGAPERI